MDPIIHLVGKERALQVFGVKLVGVTAANGRKLLFTLGFLLLVVLLSRLFQGVAHLLLGARNERTRFWTRQGIRLFTALLTIVGLCSIWFDDPTRLATALGLVTAGLAFALQRVVTAVAAYFVILRGKTFNVGDRIVMGGVRGDVISLDFMQTTIMEMGQPPGEQADTPSMWVRGRQYTGRIVTITNDKIFDTPVYNYTKDFPYIWDEMQIPISYKSDRAQAEQILLEAASKHTVQISELGEEALAELERRYVIRRTELKPRVFYRLTDNWVEMSMRFLAREAGVRDLKDLMSRDILQALDQKGIGLASGTYEIVGMPPLEIRLNGGGEPNRLPSAEQM